MNYSKVWRAGLVSAMALLLCGPLTGCDDDNDDPTILFGQYTMEGTVSDTDGVPVKDAIVTVHNVDVAEMAVIALTDADGRYEITDQKGTRKVVVTVEADGYTTSNSVLDLDFRNPTTTSLGEISLTYDVTLERKK